MGPTRNDPADASLGLMTRAERPIAPVDRISRRVDCGDEDIINWLVVEVDAHDDTELCWQEKPVTPSDTMMPHVAAASIYILLINNLIVDTPLGV